MDSKKPFDIVKEVVWNLLVYAMYFVYCFVVLLIFHFCTYRFIDAIDWTMQDILKYALIAATVGMVVRIVRLIMKKH